ncbi:cysteine desulfurase [Francisella sp. Scap27]|uniref:cysteine desulfurase family protein n=1 Tax=Francisella sp. Scap27 TaxID=2589986 RepID=UPI0015BEA268|nr:cysteine desulfurase family protein [Francisella sp. Scap27]QLE78548.1 cysteine desulfurase [Francisella sp. Scap27]
MSFIYLDYAATTPLSKRVKSILVDSINDDTSFFNSGSSTYEQAEEIKSQIEQARATIADTINVLPREIVFTSGATESNNLAIKGVAYAYKNKGNHIITSKAEHKAVLDVCKHLEMEGFEVTYLDVNHHGQIDVEDLRKSITPNTILVSLMAVNNELGTKNNLLDIGGVTKQNKILFHVDAAQGYGKVDVDINAMNIDLLSVSGHKIYAPKGVGFLYVRSKAPRVKLAKQIHGGSQEYNLRAGTLANQQIFALAQASKEMFENFDRNFDYISNLRRVFLDMLLSNVEAKEQVVINTPLEYSYPGILNLTIKNIKAETLLAILPNICLSTGSACNSQAIEPSHVLTAIGLSAEDADSTIRISLGTMTNKQEIVIVANKMLEKISLLNAISPKKIDGGENV